MFPSPPLTDPDVQISRIRFFARMVRSRSGVLVDDQSRGQRVARKHGSEALPWQIAMAAAPREPFPPGPYDLVVIPPDPPAVAGDAVVGAVSPDHP